MHGRPAVDSNSCRSIPKHINDTRVARQRAARRAIPARSQSNHGKMSDDPLQQLHKSHLVEAKVIGITAIEAAAFHPAFKAA
jgi:hypothetical protein